MSQHLADTRPSLGACARCGAWVLTCLVGGAWTGVDTVPLSLDALRAHLVAGRTVFRVVELAGRAQALRPLRLGDVERGGQLLGEHACGARPMDASAVRPAPQVPLSARVSATGPQVPRSASKTPHTGAQSHAAASAATRPRSRPRRCAQCRRLIKEGESYWGIEWGRYLWAMHDQCPKVEE